MSEHKHTSEMQQVSSSLGNMYLNTGKAEYSTAYTVVVDTRAKTAIQQHLRDRVQFVANTKRKHDALSVETYDRKVARKRLKDKQHERLEEKHTYTPDAFMAVLQAPAPKKQSSLTKGIPSVARVHELMEACCVSVNASIDMSLYTAHTQTIQTIPGKIKKKQQQIDQLRYELDEALSNDAAYEQWFKLNNILKIAIKKEKRHQTAKDLRIRKKAHMDAMRDVYHHDRYEYKREYADEES